MAAGDATTSSPGRREGRLRRRAPGPLGNQLVRPRGSQPPSPDSRQRDGQHPGGFRESPGSAERRRIRSQRRPGKKTPTKCDAISDMLHQTVRAPGAVLCCRRGRGQARNRWLHPVSKPRTSRCSGSSRRYLSTLFRATPLARAMLRALSPACPRRTTSMISIACTSRNATPVLLDPPW